MNSLDSLFSECIMKMNDNSAPLDLITKKITDTIKTSVDDTLFQPAFAKFSPSDNKIAEVYLRYLEGYYRKLAKNRTPVERNLTVEHIIPQTLSEKSDWYGTTEIPEEIDANWKEDVIESIGNKALLYSDDNSSAGNDNYVSKQNVYRNGKKNQGQGTPEVTFELIKTLLKDYPTVFLHPEVAERAAKFAEVAIKNGQNRMIKKMSYRRTNRKRGA